MAVHNAANLFRTTAAEHWTAGTKLLGPHGLRSSLQATFLALLSISGPGGSD
jgi:hypothetical protein